MVKSLPNRHSCLFEIKQIKHQRSLLLAFSHQTFGKVLFAHPTFHTHTLPLHAPLIRPSNHCCHSLRLRSGTAEKELEREVQRIADTLRDDRTANWKDRIGALHRIVALVAGGAAEQVMDAECFQCVFVNRISRRCRVLYTIVPQ
jgi:hypothetical protein